jgi:metal-dependent amidase/aminoacylase/carboxypeptidase family protein
VLFRSPEIRDLLERRVCETAISIAAAYGAKARVDYVRSYPVTVNHAHETDFAVEVASEIAGAGQVLPEIQPVMGAEDFSFMLEACPGNMIFIGNGDSECLHHPAYNFDDAAIPYGVSYWARLIERAMPV